MMTFDEAMDKAVQPYFICPGTVEAGPLYDYGVCGVLENLIYEYMDKGSLCASFNYCDFACDGECIQGCMTITIFEEVFVPIVYTILYEKDLRTYA